MHRTYAVRDIDEGEELTISYVDILAPYHERQHRLRTSLGFECSCERCSLDPADRDASDDALRIISEIEDELGDFGSQEASPELAEELLALYEDEGLQGRIGGAYTLAALNYALAGMEKETRRYATLAAETVGWEYGPQAKDAEAMRELASDPRKHWSWGKRRG